MIEVDRIMPDMTGPDILEPKAVTKDGHGFWLRCHIGIYNVKDLFAIPGVKIT
ncbi:hypothetical protein K250101E9_51370 [Enterocloster aldenensis]